MDTRTHTQPPAHTSNLQSHRSDPPALSISRSPRRALLSQRHRPSTVRVARSQIFSRAAPSASGGGDASRAARCSAAAAAAAASASGASTAAPTRLPAREYGMLPAAAEAASSPMSACTPGMPPSRCSTSARACSQTRETAYRKAPGRFREGAGGRGFRAVLPDTRVGLLRPARAQRPRTPHRRSELLDHVCHRGSAARVVHRRSDHARRPGGVARPQDRQGCSDVLGRRLGDRLERAVALGHHDQVCELHDA